MISGPSPLLLRHLRARLIAAHVFPKTISQRKLKDHLPVSVSQSPFVFVCSAHSIYSGHHHVQPVDSRFTFWY